MFRRIFYFFAPLLSLILLTLGNGLFTTVITLRMHAEGSSSLIIGLMMGAYYAGMVIGSFRCERFIARVGHIRAYATMAAFLSAVSLLQGMITNNWFSVILRFLSGFSMAGIYIVIESWLLGAASPSIRGRILAVYMIALYAAQASGQFLLNISSPQTIIPFCIVTILTAISIMPVAMTYIRSPKMSEASTLNFKKLYAITPAGVISCFCSGLILGAVYGLLPLYAAQLHYSVADVALIMSLVIYGGTILQYPVGRCSDFFERRKVLIAITLLAIVSALLMLSFAANHRWIFLIVAFLFGGFSFTMYPVSISLACDVLDKKDMVAATQGLLLAYGVGASAGPILAPLLINVLGANGLQFYFMIVGALLAIILSFPKFHPILARVVSKPYVALPRGTPIANKMDPRAEETKK